jgi:hypothetical protein
MLDRAIDIEVDALFRMQAIDPTKLDDGPKAIGGFTAWFSSMATR